MAGKLERGRAAFERRAWATAWSELGAADREARLGPDDLERLAPAAFLVGRDEESIAVWARAHGARTRAGDGAGAARCAFWLASALLNGGHLARGGGWVARAQRALEGVGPDCAEHGYLGCAAALRLVLEGDAAGGVHRFAEAAELADRCGDPQLGALARAGQGRCLLRLGQVGAAMALLDEAMVAVTAEEVSPVAAGDLYCTVIEGCQEAFDVHRAQEWTDAFGGWCEAQPELVLYRGQCLVHRAELMLLRGAWAAAAAEAGRAGARLSGPAKDAVVGAGCYVQAELHRLSGRYAEAEEGYRQAHRRGRRPQPGLAQLRLAQGRVDDALVSLSQALDEADDVVTRSRLNAMAAHATGAVVLAEGDARAALGALRAAVAAWLTLDAPYEAARSQVLVGLACRTLGDEGSAELELGAARSVFTQLGAGPDRTAAETLSPRVASPAPGGLSPREVQVLVLVATGRTNRAIAAELVISEKTVATHVSSILTKLGLPSRSAATAYAFEHHLARGSGR